MNELIPIRAFYHKHEAQLAQGLLKDNGIESIISSDDCGGYRTHLTLGMGNNRLLVKEEDAARAKVILEAFDQPLSKDELNKIEEQTADNQPQPTYVTKKNTFIAIAICLVVFPILALISFRVGATFFSKDKRDCRETNLGYECKNNYKNGHPREVEIFPHEKLFDASVYVYFPDATIEDEYHFVNKKLEGSRKTYYENGKLNTELLYKNNVLEGETKSYYETGELQSVEFYKNGELDGDYKFYSKNGILLNHLTYKNGILLAADGQPYQGILKEYYENNSPFCESHYKNGKLDGVSKSNDENGNIISETTYSNNGLDGKTINYFPKNKIQEHEVFKNNELISLSVYDDSQKLIFEKTK
jgi:antitoxin component YwqK of YwqJK toxin-antitoxin module